MLNYQHQTDLTAWHSWGPDNAERRPRWNILLAVWLVHDGECAGQWRWLHRNESNHAARRGIAPTRTAAMRSADNSFARAACWRPQRV